MATQLFGAPKVTSRLAAERVDADSSKDFEGLEGIAPVESAPEPRVGFDVRLVGPEGDTDRVLHFPLGTAQSDADATEVEAAVKEGGEAAEGKDERFPAEYFGVLQSTKQADDPAGAGGDAGEDAGEDGDTRRATALAILQSTSPVSVDVALRGLSDDTPPAGPPGPAVVTDRQHALAHYRSGLGEDAGADVGVVVVDEGVSRAYLRDLTGREPFGGGWQLLDTDGQNATAQVGRFADPYRRPCDGHGNMVARNVLALAPAATIYDAPILPPRVTEMESFASGATAVLLAILATILDPEKYGFPKHRHWVVLNAWGVSNSFADQYNWSTDPRGYLRNRDHMLCGAVRALASLPEVDVVFAAGNSGEHAPDPMSGAYDRGPHRSITGANALSEVDTVGAITGTTPATGHPIASSSQVPSAPEMLADPSKPKRLEWMPSWFTEDHDASVLNTGTSAAAALHAGRLAAGA